MAEGATAPHIPAGRPHSATAASALDPLGTPRSGGTIKAGSSTAPSPNPSTTTPPPVTSSTSSAATAAVAAAAPAYRPSPVRSFTVSGPYRPSVSGRATSQPPAGSADHLPSSSPASGRGSPGMNISDYGVIGGSRTPTSGRLSSSVGLGAAAAAGIAPPVTVTRASSFSVADKMDPKTSSLVRTLSSHLEERPSSRPSTPPAFPTFSPSSSPSTSPSMPQNQLLPTGQYSPPVAPANVSRSRSQSMATGPRPDRIMPLSTFEYSRFDESWQKDGSNMSPFTSSGRNFFDDDKPQRASPGGLASSFRTPQEPTFRSRAWGSPTTSALTTSVANALGSQTTYSSVVGGFDDTANGGRSGTSSRRHSVSVVGGPRRGFSFNDSLTQGMSAMPARRGIGQLGFTDDELLPERFDNALNLSVDESSKRPDNDKIASSLPVFSPTDAPRSIRASVPSAEAFFGSSPLTDKPERGRFGGLGDPRTRASFSAVGTGGSPPDRAASRPPPIGSGTFDGRFAGAPPASPGFRGPFNAPPPPPVGGPGAPAFGRPPVNTGGFAYFGGGGAGPAPPARPPFPQNGAGFGGMGMGFNPSYSVGPPGPGAIPPGGFGGVNYYGAPQPPAQTPTSPSSFSSLSLADLGKGIPLASLQPTTPLYIVTFKAGRRDVFYCPDPTLLISNGDRVIVEADRGSDLGTVVYDQLTPVEVREWQERQATAALLSGASQHQPPGMAMNAAAAAAAAAASTTPSASAPSHVRNGSQQPRAPAPGALDFTGADLNTLLAGVGPSGSQMDMGGGGIGARGPLAKEIMPKRIFTKSSGGPEEQARMMEKLKEEYDAMMICREKVLQRGLPMQIVDAEYQWDRRKLTFYFKADKRVDFRELTKENFRIFKSRIWMSMVPKDDPRG